MPRCAWWLPLVAWSVCFAVLDVRDTLGGTFHFDVPELAGDYRSESRDILLDLGTEFARIDSVSLQLAGFHTPGSYRDLNRPGTFPYPAEVLGTLGDLDSPQWTGFDRILQDQTGSFGAMFALTGLGGPGWEPDFSPLLDGEAKFRLTVIGPALIATTIRQGRPEVAIDSATLVVVGEEAIEPATLLGDYDGDGRIDMADYHLWKETFGSTTDLRADGNGNQIVDAGDYATWRDQVPGGTAADKTAPEPAPALLVILSSIWGLLCDRRR